MGGIKNDKKKIMMIDVIEPAETYFVKMTTIKKIIIKTINNIGWQASKIPVVHATPLPPRKPMYIGKMCPMMAASPKLIIGMWGNKLLSSIL